MDCCQCEGLELETRKWALEDLALYRQGKPVETTPMLIRALRDIGVEGLTLLDIGGGIGAIAVELLTAGAANATSVEASTAYSDIARQEAARAGLGHRITYLHGDFVALASQIPLADIVTLDRVVCCYHDVSSLVSLSSAKAGRLYALVYPRDTRWATLTLPFKNWGYRLRRSPFRTFIHPTALVDGLIRSNGFTQVYHRETFAWQVVVYQHALTTS